MRCLDFVWKAKRTRLWSLMPANIWVTNETARLRKMYTILVMYYIKKSRIFFGFSRSFPQRERHRTVETLHLHTIRAVHVGACMNHSVLAVRVGRCVQKDDDEEDILSRSIRLASPAACESDTITPLMNRNKERKKNVKECMVETRWRRQRLTIIPIRT